MWDSPDDARRPIGASRFGRGDGEGGKWICVIGRGVVLLVVEWTMVEVVDGTGGMPPYPGRPKGKEGGGRLGLTLDSDPEEEDRFSMSERRVAIMPIWHWRP